MDWLENLIAFLLSIATLRYIFHKGSKAKYEAEKAKKALKED